MFKEFHHQARGRGHLRDGTPVQDRTMYLSRGGTQVICLADGAGSASHSGFGAQVVVDEGCKIFLEKMSDFADDNDGAQVKAEIISRLISRLETLATKLDCDLKDLASTFLCVAVHDNMFFGAHVGDGVIGILRNGESRVLSAPDNSEFANQTTFVTSSGAINSMRLFRGALDGVEGFILMSDGAGDSLFNSRTRELAGACAKLIKAVGEAPARQSKSSEYKKRLRKLLDIPIRNATKDDCSIGILGR